MKFRDRDNSLLIVMEGLVYRITAVLLLLSVFLIFIYSLYDLVMDIMAGDFIGGIIMFLSHLLLALMTVELMYTVIVSIESRSLQPEPILIVGLIAAIRRILTLSVEATNLMDKDVELFKMALYEIGVLTASVLVLVVAIWILRRPAGK